MDLTLGRLNLRLETFGWLRQSVETGLLRAHSTALLRSGARLPVLRLNAVQHGQHVCLQSGFVFRARHIRVECRRGGAAAVTELAVRAKLNSELFSIAQVSLSRNLSGGGADWSAATHRATRMVCGCLFMFVHGVKRVAGQLAAGDGGVCEGGGHAKAGLGSGNGRDGWPAVLLAAAKGCLGRAGSHDVSC